MGDPFEIELIAVVLGLFLLPRILERWFIPSAISAFCLGILYRYLDLSLQSDITIGFLSVLGISTLFLLAGLEVEINEMRKVWRVLLGHILIRALLILSISVGCHYAADLTFATSSLVAIGLVTPSAGFILDALKNSPLTEEQRFWVKTKAISAELFALGLMFVVMQSGSIKLFLLTSSGMIGVLILLPVVLLSFAKLVAPHAKNAEFSFFILLAVIVGIITKKLGTYYLVGAFIVGLAVQRLEHLFPVMDMKKLFSALKLFCAFFIPFYFFRSGAGVTADDLSFASLKIGFALVIFVLPIRIGAIALHRRIYFRESLKESLPVALSLTPTLVFGLVIAGILRANYELSSELYGAFIIYTIASTVLPGFFLRNTQFQDVQEPFEALHEYPTKV